MPVQVHTSPAPSGGGFGARDVSGLGVAEGPYLITLDTAGVNIAYTLVMDALTGCPGIHEEFGNGVDADSHDAGD